MKSQKFEECSMKDLVESVPTAKIIEASMLSSSMVRECTIMERKTANSESESVAYVVPAGPFSPARLTEHLRAALPGVKLPGHYVPLFALPRDAQGNVDTNALLAIEVI